MPKLAKPLTDTQVRNAKSKDKVFTMADGGGMYLEISPTGSKIWRMSYRQANGKQNRLTFGAYPSVTLEEAREKRAAARKLISQEIDPAEHKKTQKALKVSVSANTFQSVAGDWFKVKIKPLSESHCSRTLAYLENDLIPYLGKKNIADIKAPELLACLRRIESRKNNQGKNVTETPNRVRTLMSGLWRFAIQQGKADRDIAADLKGALTTHTQKNYSHITDAKLLAQLLRDIDSFNGTFATKAALKLLPHVFTRPGELRQARWEDIDFEEKKWEFFSGKTKIEHIVPLSAQALEILQSMLPITGSGEFVFSVGAGSRPLSEGTLNQALKRLGYSGDVIQPHGFRHTAATALAELGFDENKIDRQLSHLVAGVKGVYQKAKYLDDRKHMLQTWSNYLDALKAGGEVVSIRTKKVFA